MAHSLPASHRRIAWLLLAAVLLALFGYPLLLGMPLCDPDEGLHAAIAQEMVERGDWITPRMLGESFRDKPILYFWLQALSLSWLGMSEMAVRLPGLLLGALGAVTTGCVAWRLHDRTTGFVAAALYATMILPTAMAQMPVHDVALVPTVNLSLLGLWDAEHATTWRRRVTAGLGAGLMLGLAGLAKGLVGVAVVGVAYGLYLAVDRGPAAWRSMRGVSTPHDRDQLAAIGPIIVTGILSLLVGLLVAAPWYLTREIHDPGYLRYFFVDRHVKGFVAGDTQFHGGRPVWYYLPFLLLGAMPAILYLPALVRDAWARRRLDHPTLFAMTWLVGGAVFFSAASCKLPTYIWPLFPAFAVLAAEVWKRLMEGTLTGAARTVLSVVMHGSCFLGPIILPAVAGVSAVVVPLEISPLGWAVILLVAGLFLVPLGWWRSQRYAECLVAGCLAVAVQFMVFMTLVAAPLFARFSARDLAAHFNGRGGVHRQVITLDVRASSLVFYLDPAFRRDLQAGQLVAWRSRAFQEWSTPAPGALIAVADCMNAKVARSIDLVGLPNRDVGHWRIYDATDVVRRLEAAGALPSVHFAIRGSGLPASR